MRKEEKKLEKVSIVRCINYEQKRLDKAVKKVLDLAGIKIPKRKKVLIKPNLVHAYPKNKEATTTNAKLVKSVCKILKKNNCKIFIGESSFMDTDDAFVSSGINKIIKEFKAKKVIFEQDKLIKIKDSKAKILKEFEISKTLHDVDLIINMPKLKTHQLTKFTGAIKNLYGVIPGGMKQKLHLIADNEKKFSSLLIDIYQNIKPEINIMDGIIGMEGRGPTGGETKKAGYILASKNAISLDVVSSKLIGYKPKEILAIKEGVKRKLGSFEYELIGLKKLPLIKFKKPFVSIISYKIAKRIFIEKPIICDKSKCIKCGLCASKCPAKAISMKPYPVIDKKKCIRCFCCIEVCPQSALSLKGKDPLKAK